MKTDIKEGIQNFKKKYDITAEMTLKINFECNKYLYINVTDFSGERSWHVRFL